MLPGAALNLPLSRGNVAHSSPSKRMHSVEWAAVASGSWSRKAAERASRACVGVVCVVGVRNAVGSWKTVFQDPTARGLAPGPCGFRGQTVECVVAVSYSPTPSQVQYHRRLRA